MSIANSCAINLERGIARQEWYDEVFEREAKEYLANIDWKDVAAQTEEMMPTLLALVYRGQWAAASFHIEAMLNKAARDHATTCANNAMED